MNRLRKGLCCLLLLCAGSAAAADAPAWRLDPAHTRVLFRVDHAGFSTALGLLPAIEGELRFDPDDWATARVEARVPLAQLQLGDEAWNQTMLSRSWFDAGNHPLAQFRSTRVEPTGEGTARVHGVLQLRGVEKPLVLDVRLNKLGRNPVGFRRTVGFSASATLDRRDFGLERWTNLVGSAVALEIQLEAVRSNDGSDKENGNADPQHD
ncbi:YceI family protein [Arenimonas sp. SCN 70-307]|uniref:YceI family protein n=1 Tax=Arenimonas sp. SCN 70-307 TaxID=1660089 RepID=UPI0025C21FE8|nr:YceI family protein [Arenimonas sp. SCN 70-307]